MDWTQGYIADIEYIHGFYGELAPEQLAMAALLRGSRPPLLEEGFTYFELGCGQGDSLNLLAACNPQGRFYGNDFNPTHIAGAQALADAAGLKNVTILEKSFQELQSMDLPQFDFICLHGIYSWINAENRRLIVDFIRGRLKPGSLVYISYNCLPGWSATAPLRRLMTDYAHASGGGVLTQQVEKALAFTARLRDLKMGFFTPNPQLDARLAQIQTVSRNYLTHEYFNKDWIPFYHADMVRDMAEAKLSFVGPASYGEQLEFLLLPQNALALLAEIQEPVLRETIKDFLLNQQFRKDVFVRGKIAMQISEQRELLRRKRFMLATPRADVPLTVRFMVGDVNLLPDVYNPVLDELDKGPCTLTDVSAALVPGKLTQEQIQHAVLVMLASGHVVLAPTGFEDKRKDATKRFNAVVVERALQGDDLQFLASPVACSGVHVDIVDRLFLNALKKKQEPVAYAWDVLRAKSQVLFKNGKALATPEENLKELAERHKLFSEKRLSRLQKLGIA
jgi:SAM-dependent methyltransferase